MMLPPKTKAVIYARVSGDDRPEEGRNLIGQLELCSRYAASKDYEIIAQLAEDERGVSGADFDAPQLKRAIQMARQGKFDVLIVRQIDRLARNLAKQLTAESELTQAGVKIEYVLQNFADDRFGRFNKNIFASIAELEREEITARTNRGKRNKVKTGHVVTAQNAPYGYKQVTIDDGKQMLEIEPDEAKVIALIFDWYINRGWSYRRIAAELTRQTRHYRRDGRLLTTLDEVVRAIIDNDLEVTR